MAKPDVTTSNTPRSGSGSRRSCATIEMRCSSTKRASARSIIGGELSSPTSSWTSGRAANTSAINRPSPQPRSSARAASLGSTSANSRSPAARASTRPMRSTYSSTLSTSRHVDAGVVDSILTG